MSKFNPPQGDLMPVPNDWVAWIPPACVLTALLALAVMGFFPRPPRH